MESHKHPSITKYMLTQRYDIPDPEEFKTKPPGNLENGMIIS